MFFPLHLLAGDRRHGAAISDQAVAKIDSFMKNGGTIFFDTRDAATPCSIHQA